MEDPAILDLVRELDDILRLRAPELEVDLELAPAIDDDLFDDPWFLLTEDDIAAIEDDPTAKVVEIRVRDYGPALGEPDGFAEKRWAF